MPFSSTPVEEVKEEKKDEENEEEESNEANDLMFPGKKICRTDFKTEKCIGRGSFGKVFMVTKKGGDGTVYAMKVLSKAMVAKRNLIIKT
jgi:hypothetical protein